MADPLGSVEKIVKIVLLIKEAVDKVRKNKEECREIRKRVVRVSALLTRLQETEMMKDPATGRALEELEETLTIAHELVTACQRKNMLAHFCTSGNLAKRLREVKQDISDLMVDGIFATNVNATIILKNIQFAACTPSRKDAGMVKIHSSHTTDSDRSDAVETEKRPSAIPFPCLKNFILPELEVATNTFSKENIVGDGASAVVYKGVLQNGLVVAIKKFRDSIGFSEAHFYDEFNLVPKLEHKCVTKLVGYCHEVTVSLEWSGGRYVGVQRRHCFFVEEYMPNGSLETIINGFPSPPRDWCTLFKIIQGIADGLRYLHEQHVVHSDLKPSNILLDHNMNPKISDFGIARILDHGDDPTTRDVNYLAGTMGYMPPEYIVEGILSTKYDVYSFGIILLETVGIMCLYEQCRRQASVEWAWKVRNAESLREFFYPLHPEGTLKQIKRCIDVGLLCTQLKPADRPAMADVLEMLNDERRELHNPKKPRYTKKIAHSSNVKWIPPQRETQSSRSCEAEFHRNINTKFSDKTRSKNTTKRTQMC